MPEQDQRHGVGIGRAVPAVLDGASKEMSAMKHAVIIATVLAFAGCHAGPRSVRFGALTVRVSDSKTGQALAGVRVVHVVETIVSRPPFLGVFPHIDADIGRRVRVKRHGITDGDGRRHFDPLELALSDNERIADETVYVNVLVDMGAEESRSMLAILRESCASGHPTCGGAPDDVDVLVRAVTFNEAERRRALTNPLPSYKGLVLRESKGQQSPKEHGWVTERDPLVVEWGLVPNHQADRAAFARLSKAPARE
jgi:hypothetical protein